MAGKAQLLLKILEILHIETYLFLRLSYSFFLRLSFSSFSVHAPPSTVKVPAHTGVKGHASQAVHV